MRNAAYRPVWKDGFLFLGNELVLDFLNTRPVKDGNPTELLPDFSAVLRWFEAADLLDSEQVGWLKRHWERTSNAERATEDLRDFRERWRKDILAWEEGRVIRTQTFDELNRLMGLHPMRTRLTKSGTSYSTRLWLEVREPADMLAPLAQSAATLLATGDRTRVRKCANCVLHFHDTSKKGTRRWCSMQLCGNRFKVAAYAARQQKRQQS